MSRNSFTVKDCPVILAEHRNSEQCRNGKDTPNGKVMLKPNETLSRGRLPCVPN